MYYFINNNELIGYSDNTDDMLVFPIDEIKELTNIDVKTFEEYQNCFDIENDTLILNSNLLNRQRLDQLTLTPADVERALYKANSMDFDDLKTLIAERAPQIDLKGLAIEFRANNFYRGAIDKDGNRIIDMVGAILGYTPEDMDYLFEHKELPSKTAN